MNKLYKAFQYMLVYLVFLCVLLTITNVLFSYSIFATSLAAIIDAIVAVFIILVFVHPH